MNKHTFQSTLAGALAGALAGIVLGPIAAAQSIDLEGTERPDHEGPPVLDTLPMPPMDMEDVHDRIYYDRPDGETLWARGATYKASFGSGGATFTPFLGSDAPRNFPVRMQLEEVTVGGVPVPHTSGARAERSGDFVSLDRGILSENYAIELDRIEQLFAFPAQIGFGDLVLRLDVDTELTGSLDASGLHFRGPAGGVDYGTVTVIDTNGDSVQAALEWDAGDLSITVPAAFVDNARYPIVVDPILSTFVVESLAGTDFSNPDLAYHDGLNGYLAVYEERFSGNDTDLFSRIVQENGFAFSQGYVDQTDDDWNDPAVAELGDRFMCVATLRPAGTSFHVTVGRTRAAGVNTWTPTVNFSVLDDRDDIHPDVAGGESLLFRVVWEEEVSSTNHNIMYRAAYTTGNPFGSIQQVTNNASVTDRDPRIADDLDAASASFPVVWTRAQGTQRDVWGAILPSIGEFPIDTGPTSQSAPDVSPILDGVGDGVYLVAYQQDFGDFDVMVRAMSVNQTIDLLDLSVAENAFMHHQYAPRVASDGERFVVGYSYLPLTGNNANLYLSTVNLVGSELCVAEVRVPIANGTADEGQLAIAAAHTGGGDRRRFMPMWTKSDTDSDIFAAVYESPDALCHGTNYCAPNPNSTGMPATISAYGQLQAGQFLTLAASGMPQNQFGYFLGSRNAGFIAGPGGSQGNFCLGGPTARFNAPGQIESSGLLGRFEVEIDTSSIPLTPVTTVVSGETWRFQTWYRDGQASNFSDGLEIVFE